MEYGAIEHTSGYKMMPPEAAVPSTCDPTQQRNESEFENGDPMTVAPPISRSSEPDNGSDSANRACVEDSEPPTTAAVCNAISSSSYLPSVEYHQVEKLSDPSIEHASVSDHSTILVAKGSSGGETEGELGDRQEAEESYHSNTNDHVNNDDHHNDNRLLVLGGGVASTRKRSGSPIIHLHHQNIIIQGEEEEDQVKRRRVRIREGDEDCASQEPEQDSEHPAEDPSPVCLVTSDYHQQGGGVVTTETESSAVTQLSYLDCVRDLRVIHQQDRFVTLEASDSHLHQLQDITDTALYGRRGVKEVDPRLVNSDSVHDRYTEGHHLEQLTVVSNNNDMPYSSTSSSANGLEDLRMRHLDEDVNIITDGIIVAAQQQHFPMHSQQLRIRGEGFSFGALFPHLSKPDAQYNTPQILSFSIQHHHDREAEDIIDKSRIHSQVNGSAIDDVINATLKSEEEVNPSDDARSERTHHQYHLITASPQHPEQEEYLQQQQQQQHHQESPSPDVSRNGRSTSPEQPGSVLENLDTSHHLQHHRDVILSGRGGGEGGRLLGNSNLSSGAANSTNNNSGSNASSFTHLTTLQPSSSSTPSPLGLGGNSTAEGAGGGSTSVLQQLSPAGDEDANEHQQHREMYTTTPSALEHHHAHHLSGLHPSGFHPHDAVAVSSASALIHSPAANLPR
ncbi:hypothetical protein C0J52_21025 [Blattella germanica]|nr:hypothetical protein C0J52_21025 [Blattella germanica]